MVLRIINESTSFYSYAIIVKRSLADKSYELIFCSLQRKIQHVRYSLELTTQYISIQSNIFLNSSLERYQNSERRHLLLTRMSHNVYDLFLNLWLTSLSTRICFTPQASVSRK
jgi:hypothetical protein